MKLIAFILGDMEFAAAMCVVLWVRYWRQLLPPMAAVVEYSPVTRASGDPMTEIVTRNVANYVQYIGEAAKQVAFCTLET
jgi:hypothetical protein